MSRVLAALGNDSAARPVAATAGRLAGLLDASPDAVHVREDGQRTAEASASVGGMPLRTLSGPALAALAAESRHADVLAVVLGTRAVADGDGPAGSTALSLITRIRKPVVVVPPTTPHAGRIERLLVPLDGTQASSQALAQTIRLAGTAGVEIIVLHVHEKARVPSFSDHVEHEAPAWSAEFLARYCPVPPGDVRLELRVGAPSEHVVDVAARLDVDLVALGWSQNLAPGHAAVVREALARSPVPVLLVPVADEQAPPAAARS